MICTVCGEEPEMPIPCKCVRDRLAKKCDIRDLKRRVLDICAGVNAAVKSLPERAKAVQTALNRTFRLELRNVTLDQQAQAIAEHLYDEGIRADNYKDTKL